MIDFGDTLKPGSLEFDCMAVRRADWGYTCGPYRAGDADGSPDSLIVEALMVIAKQTCDAAGLQTLFCLPPATAVAIIRAFQSGDPVAFARQMLK